MTTDRTETLLTIEEFERLPDDEWRTELVRGRLVREPSAGMDHGRVEIRLAVLVANFADRHALGDVFGADTGYVLFEDPPTVRVPDVSFVSAARLPSPEDSIRFGRMAPDLAVEVISPSNTATEILEKTADYLNAGTRLLWIVEPRRRCVTVHRPQDKVRLLREGDELEGYDVLPGFSVPVARIFTGSPGTGRPSPDEST
jgi:Uma2 family endonuclease